METRVCVQEPKVVSLSRASVSQTTVKRLLLAHVTLIGVIFQPTVLTVVLELQCCVRLSSVCRL